MGHHLGVFSRADLEALTAAVADAWRAGAGGNWSAQAGTVEWSCTRTADHAIDCTFAPAFFLASRKQDAYPDMGAVYTVGPDATPGQLVQALSVASRVLAAVVADADPEVRAVIRRRPEVMLAPPLDFLARGVCELILHAHDVCKGLGVPFDPPSEVCTHLIEHTADWPWSSPGWSRPSPTDDPWGELLRASGRAREPRLTDPDTLTHR
jgi:hypothetical protein